MKICLLCRNGYPVGSYPTLGGIQSATFYLSHALKSHGVEVHVITRGKLFRTEDEGGVYLHYIPIPDTIWENRFSSKINIKHMIYYIIYDYYTYKLLHSLHPDIIHCQDPTQKLVAFLSKLILHIPSGVVYHSNWKIRYSGILGKTLRRPLCKLFPPSFHVCLTPEAKREIDKALGTTSIFIPNGVDTSVFYPIFAPENKIKTKMQYILCVSRLAPGKGIEDALVALKIVLATNANIHMFIVGDGPIKGELLQLVSKLNINDNITFTGSLDAQNVAKYYNLAHIFLQTSYFETFSLVLLEACACALPILSTPVGIAPIIISKNKNGYLIPFHNPNELAKKIRLLFQNPILYQSMSNNSLLAIMEYQWSVVAQQFINVYSEHLLESKK